MSLVYKSLQQLGFQPVLLNALYRLILETGFYKRGTRTHGTVFQDDLKDIFNLPGRELVRSVLGREGARSLQADSDEIVKGKVRLFGAVPAPMRLSFSESLRHWTEYERDPSLLSNLFSSIPDIKMIWEPARFGWSFTLGRAYYIIGDEKYPEAFWHHFENFINGNPVDQGPHWMSGQEVALRLMAFVWAAQVFKGSPHSTPERRSRITRAVIQHALRIPSTLLYARSQDNNHLLTEAAGLLTAGLALPGLRESARWRDLGWKWFHCGIQRQIDSYGEYSQHSTNYHRMMLQVALWVLSIHPDGRQGFPKKSLDRLNAAVHWLLSLLDPVSGQTPNLGANDGAYIYPLTVCPFEDYRPVVQAAGRAFAGYELPAGHWDEMCLWFQVPLKEKSYVCPERYVGDQLYTRESWAYLRTAQFKSRPSHADQLHLDLWWRGLNIARDAGTYLYNAPPPWENSLTGALLHNTVTVNNLDQFNRVGKFLYLDWFDAYRTDKLQVDENILHQISGCHYGYRKYGVCHERQVTSHVNGCCSVVDILRRTHSIRKPRRLDFRLHWLLPDWEWDVERSDQGASIRLKSPCGGLTMRIDVTAEDPQLSSNISLARAGELLWGKDDVPPMRGWFSPTYAIKVPALSVALTASSSSTVHFKTEFILPGGASAGGQA